VDKLPAPGGCADEAGARYYIDGRCSPCAAKLARARAVADATVLRVASKTRARQRASSPIDRDQHHQAGKRVVLAIPRGGKVSEVGFLSAISRSAGELAAPDGAIA
jgi:hypothetical protein